MTKPAGYTGLKSPYTVLSAYVPSRIGERGTFLLSGSSSGPTRPFFSPIIMQLGQSNAQGQDLATTDPKTGLAFVPANGWIYRVNNPTQSSVVPYPFSPHGIELSLGNDLSSAQGVIGAPIVDVKAGANGSSLQSWIGAGANIPILQGAIVSAKAASALRQVAFVCQQGETEAQGAGSGTYQADLTTFFANVRTLFGPEYSVRFYVIVVNPNTPTAPNLAVVRAAQDAACAADINAVAVHDFDSIVPALAGGLHYGLGQTFPMGSTIASRIISDYPNSLGKAGIGVSADVSMFSILGARLKFANETFTDAITTTLITDETVNANNFNAVGMIVTASDATLQNLRTLNIPIAVATPPATAGLITPTPSPGTPFTIFWIRKLMSHTGSAQFIDSSGFNNDGATGFENSAANAVESFAGTVVTPGFANSEPLNTWMFGMNQFSGQATDIVQGGRFAIQGNAGTTVASGVPRQINGYGGGNGGNIQQAMLAYAIGAVTISEINRVRNFYAKKFFISVSPLNPLVTGL